MAQIDFKKCTVKIKDGSTTPNELEIKSGPGNVTWSEKKTREYMPDRGLLDGVRDADEEPLDLSFEFQWIFLKSITGATTPTIEEALKGTGAASDWVSVDSDTCQPYAVDIEIEYDPDCTGNIKEIILFEDFRYENLAHDLRAGTVSVTGRCNVTEPTITRET
jgi:hypothetical protein